MPTRKLKTYTVIYRTGGTDNFKWHKCLPVNSYREAEADAQEIERGGRRAIIHKTAFLDSCGLPESYDASSPIPGLEV